MPRSVSALVALPFLALAGCAGDDAVIRDRFDAVEARLAGIERRLADAEKGVPGGAALREQVDRLDLRLGSLEARIAQMAAAAAAPVPGSGGAASRGAAAGAAHGAAGADSSLSPQALAARERATALRALQVEYRRRLDGLRARREAGASMPELRAERSEITSWYRDQRRAVLLGQSATP